jgi:outer membrane protein assembly factor BamB
MITTKRAALMLAVAAVLATGCQLFPGGDRDRVTEAERAQRQRWTGGVFEQELKADPELAGTTITLPPVSETADWAQSGVTAAKLPGHLKGGDEFRVDWRVGYGAGSGQERHIVAPPVAKDGRIFTIDASQNVSAFDVNGGRRVWRTELHSANRRDTYTVGGGLAVAGDKVIVSSGFGFVAALSVADGHELWRRRTDSPMSGQAAILGERAYVTSTNNELYALDVNTGEVLWTDQAIAESARILSAPSPAVNNDVLVAPYSSGELIAYLPANGRRLWTDTLTTVGRFTPLSAINDIAGRPTIENGVIYAASHSGILTAIDARSGQRLWTNVFGSRLGPVICGDYIFVVGANGQVAALNKGDGKAIWVRQLPEYKNQRNRQGRIVWTGPLVASNKIVVASSEGNVVALNPQNGETVSELRVGQAIFAEPIAASGRIFLVTDNAQLIAIK